jgi:NADH-ubiquinone oxidoreductase chain 6
LFWGIIVVFGYTTAIATVEYPEMWSSNVLIWSTLLLGFLVELVWIVVLINNSINK